MLHWHCRRWLCRNGHFLRWLYNPSSTVKINNEGDDSTSHEGRRGVWVEPADQRIVRVAVLGTPNAGKSTLVNQLLGHKVFAASPKVHTTRRKAAGVFTEGNTQMVLLDTPGAISYHLGRKLKLSKAFLSDPHRSLIEADVVVVIVDVSNKWTREKLDPTILHALCSFPHIPAVLVLNKVDLLGHKHVLLHVVETLTKTAQPGGVVDREVGPGSGSPQIRPREGMEGRGGGEMGQIPEGGSSLRTGLKGETAGRKDGGVETNPQELEHTGLLTTKDGDNEQVPIASHREELSWNGFQEVYMVSALTGDGMERLKSFILASAKPGAWEYSMTEYTDQPALVLVEDIVREKLLLYLNKEIPYTVTQDNVIWEWNSEDVLVIYQNLSCKSKSQASIVIGPAGGTIQTITAEAKEDLEALFRCSVDLTLNVRTSKK